MCHLTLWSQNSYSWKSSSLPTLVLLKICFFQEVTTKKAKIWHLFAKKSKNQSCHTSLKYETKTLHNSKAKLTNTLMTKDDDGRVHFLQSAEGRCGILRFCSIIGKNEQSWKKLLTVEFQKSLCVLKLLTKDFWWVSSLQFQGFCLPIFVTQDTTQNR